MVYRVVKRQFQGLQIGILNHPVTVNIKISKTAKNESQFWHPLAAKQGNLAVPAQRHVIAPFITFLLLYGGFIQGVSNKQVIDDFLEKCTKIVSKLGIFWAYYSNGNHFRFSSNKMIFLTNLNLGNINLTSILL